MKSITDRNLTNTDTLVTKNEAEGLLSDTELISYSNIVSIEKNVQTLINRLTSCTADIDDIYPSRPRKKKCERQPGNDS